MKITFKEGDTLVVKSVSSPTEHVFHSVREAVEFLSEQRPGSAWNIRHVRYGEEVDPGYLWPLKLMDAYRHREIEGA